MGSEKVGSIGNEREEVRASRQLQNRPLFGDEFDACLAVLTG